MRERTVSILRESVREKELNDREREREKEVYLGGFLCLTAVLLVACYMAVEEVELQRP